jgi:hypothetical protein
MRKPRSIDMPIIGAARAAAWESTIRADLIAAKEASPAEREKLIDEAVEETFPASDPPSYMGGAAIGGPRRGALKPGETEKPLDRSAPKR